MWIRAIEQIEKFIFIDDQAVWYTRSKALNHLKVFIFVYFLYLAFTNPILQSPFYKNRTKVQHFFHIRKFFNHFLRFFVHFLHFTYSLPYFFGTLFCLLGPFSAFWAPFQPFGTIFGLFWPITTSFPALNDNSKKCIFVILTN